MSSNNAIQVQGTQIFGTNALCLFLVLGIFGSPCLLHLLYHLLHDHWSNNLLPHNLLGQNRFSLVLEYLNTSIFVKIVGYVIIVCPTTMVSC
jgi:hypothetical protein